MIIWRKKDPMFMTLEELVGMVVDDFDPMNKRLFGKGGGSGGGTTTVNNSTAPPPQVMAAYQTALNSAQSAASQPLQQYNAPVVAGFAPDQLSAFQQVAGAQGIANPYINAAQSAITAGTSPLWSNTQQFSPTAISQYNSPYTTQVLNAQIAAENNQDAQQQAALQGNAISSGAWGGDRAGVASAILSGQQDIANNQANANILNQGYNTALGEFNTQQQAQLGANEANDYLQQQAAFGLAGLGTEAQNTTLAGANAQEASGAIQQQLAQAQLNIPYEQFLQSQAYPFQTAQYFANIAEGIGSNSGGVGQSTTTTPSPSIGSQIAGFGLGGLGILGATGAFGQKRGGRINAFGRGGRARYAMGGLIPQRMAMGGIPDLSTDFIPNSQSSMGRGPPQASQSSVTRTAPSQGSGMSAGDLAAVGKGAKGLYSWINSLGTSSGNPLVSALDPTAQSELGGITNPLDMYDLAGNPSAPAAAFDAASGSGAADIGAGAGAGITNPLDMFDAAGNATSATAGLDSAIGGAPGIADIVGADAGSGVIPLDLFDAAGNALTSGGALAGAGDLGFGFDSAMAGIDAGATDAAASAAADISFSDIFDAIASFFAFKKGGVVRGMGRGHAARPRHHFDVGGVTPTTAAVQGQQQPTQTSIVNNMSPEQIQAMMLRMPIGSPQQRQLQQVLNQKRMMPNVGAQAQQPGAIQQGQQQPQQQPMGQYGGLARGGRTRRGFAPGGDVDPGIPINAPPPPEAVLSDQLMRAQELGDLPGVSAAGADVQRVPLSDLVPQGRGPHIGAGPPQPESVPSPSPAAALPPPDTMKVADAGPKAGVDKDDYYADEEPPNSRTPAKANPWLALAEAGFAMAGGTSPYAAVNIGKGAEAGFKNYTEQQKEADTVNDAADKLMAEAKQHKDSLAQEQARTDEEHRHNVVLEDQGKYTPIKDMLGNVTGLMNTKDGTVRPVNSEAISGVAGTPGSPAPTTNPDGTPVIPRSTDNIFNPPKGSDGKPVMGDAYLKSIPASVEGQARDYIAGNLPPPSGFASKPSMLAAYHAAQVADPDFAKTAGTRFSTIQDFTKGPKTASTVQSQNVAMEHIQTMQQAIDALNQGNMPAWNYAMNELAKQSGKAPPTNFELGKTFLSDELNKAVLGAGGAAIDRENVAKNLNLGSSNSQAQGFIDTAGKFMAGQSLGLEQRYKAGTALDNYRDRFLLPRAQTLIDRYHPDQIPPKEELQSGKVYHTARGPATWNGQQFIPLPGSQ